MPKNVAEICCDVTMLQKYDPKSWLVCKFLLQIFLSLLLLFYCVFQFIVPFFKGPRPNYGPKDLSPVLPKVID